MACGVQLYVLAHSASMSLVRITEFSPQPLYGIQEHLAALADAISELYPKPAVSNSDNESEAQYDLDVLTAESNQEKYTYDGIDWGGERLVAEVCLTHNPVPHRLCRTRVMA